MTIKHLKIFIAVYEAESMTKASERLGMTQPAVTRAIQELEQHYGVTLFERINKRIMITETAKQFYSRALYIIDSFDKLESGVKSWDESGTVRIGASITIGTVYMPEIVTRLKLIRPDLDIKVKISNIATLQNWLNENKLDVAVFGDTPNDPELDFEAFGHDNLVLLMPCDHPLSEQVTVSLTDIAKYPFLAREYGSDSRMFIRNIFASKGISLRPVWESVSTEAIVKAVSLGIGITILPELLVKDAIDSGIVVTRPVTDASFLRKHYIVWHKNKHLTAHIEDLKKIVKEVAQ